MDSGKILILKSNPPAEPKAPAANEFAAATKATIALHVGIIEGWRGRRDATRRRLGHDDPVDAPDGPPDDCGGRMPDIPAVPNGQRPGSAFRGANRAPMPYANATPTGKRPKRRVRGPAASA